MDRKAEYERRFQDELGIIEQGIEQRGKDEARFLNLLNRIQEALQQHPVSPVALGTILEVYGSIIRLLGYLNQAKLLLESLEAPDDKIDKQNIILTEKEVDVFVRFFKELYRFDTLLRELNLHVIDIYYPGFSDTFIDASWDDKYFEWEFKQYIVPKYNIDIKDAPPALKSFLETYSDPGNYFSRRHVDFSHFWVDGESEGKLVGQVNIDIVSHVGLLLNSLNRCRDILAQIVRENWNFRDLAVLDQHRGDLIRIEKGAITKMGDQYNIDRSQVGAVGHQTHVDNSNFIQVWQEKGSNYNLSVLANELAKLRTELRKEATEREHDTAVVAVGDAEAAAKEGNGPKMLQSLAKAGVWTLDIATKIGTTVAAGALKEALGIK